MARRFQFRLQKLLEIRAHKEKLVKNEMGKAQAKKVAAIEKKENIKRRFFDQLLKMKKDEENKVLSIKRLQYYQTFFRKLKEDTNHQDEIISLIDEEIKLINKRLIEAQKDKKILERLKERKLDEHKKEVLKEEQDFFDDIGNSEYVRKIRKMRENFGKKRDVKIPIKYKESFTSDIDFIHQIYQEVFGGGELK